MAVVRLRGAPRKRGPLKYVHASVRYPPTERFRTGHRFVFFKIRSTRRWFSVHEDLICQHSGYFKAKLQKGRNTVEGECRICHEELETNTDDIVFCRARCGQNIHQHCLDAWKSSQDGALTCPICHHQWQVAVQKNVLLDGGLDQTAVQMYQDWLYTGEIRIDEDTLTPDCEQSTVMLKAWTVATTLQDQNFQHAVVAEMLAKPFNPSSSYAEYAFYESDDEEMRDFIIDWFVTFIEPAFFEEQAQEFPPPFVLGLGEALLRERLEGRVTREGMLEEYTDGKYEFVNE